MLKVISFVPLRGNSKSIPKKNIKPLNGKPLAYWSIKALQDSQEVDKIVVATDCVEIESTIKGFNFNKVELYKREAENATDTASTESVMLEYINKSNLNPNDLFILVQATSPFTKSSDIDNAVKQLKNSNSDSLLSAVLTKRFYWEKNGTPLNYNYYQRPRRQDFEGTYLENGAFYISYIKNIIEHQNRISGKVEIFPMDEISALEIDEEIDWIIAEHLISKNINS